MQKVLKNIRFLAAAFLLLLQGCSKEELIELTPDFSLDATTNPSSMTQVNEVLVGTYSMFREANYYGSGSGTGAGWALMPDILSDNVYETIESLANSRAMADWTFNESTGQVNSMYIACYRVIAGANIVLRDIDKFTTAANQKLANRVKGQAYAIRALAHFDLFRYFAVKFDRNSTSDLAVAYSKEFTVSTSYLPSRLNNKEFYDNVLADLSQALTLLGDVDQVVNPTSGLTRPYLDQTAVYAIQARAYLYGGMWTEAAAAATNAITRRPLATGAAAFTGMYNQTNAGEIIWNVQFESGQSGPSFLVYFPTNGRSYFRPALEVATTAGATGLILNNDVRYSAFFTTVSGGLAVTKYKGKGTVSDGNANFIAFRTGEMYLIRAEARAKGGQEGLALDDLNVLRAARITGYVPEVGLTGTALLDAIANERRRELIAEGHRFFDLKRTTRVVTRGSTCGTSTSSAGDCTLAATDREWAFPIPEAVRNVNKNATQNPGYAK